VTTIVKELRYIDTDWRSQLAHPHNSNFHRYATVTTSPLGRALQSRGLSRAR
jgi:hypothetical protein